jgi:hypothetical protein
MKAAVRKIRCAIYTRVSTDERLDMEFNSEPVNVLVLAQ